MEVEAGGLAALDTVEVVLVVADLPDGAVRVVEEGHDRVGRKD